MPECLEIIHQGTPREVMLMIIPLCVFGGMLLMDGLRRLFGG